MTKRLALIATGSACLLILGLNLWGHPAAGAGFALLTAAMPALLAAVGAARQGRLGSAAIPIGGLFVLLATSSMGILILTGRIEEAPWVAGLPLAPALQLFGLFLVPLAWVAVGYAWTFRHHDVSDRDLDRLRRLAAGKDRP